MPDQKLPTTSTFIKSSPAMKAAMVVDAYIYMAEQLEKMQHEIKVLSAWLDCTPSLIEMGKCHVLNAERLAEFMKNFEASRDNLTARLIDHDAAVKKFTKYITKRQFV